MWIAVARQPLHKQQSPSPLFRCNFDTGAGKHLSERSRVVDGAPELTSLRQYLTRLRRLFPMLRQVLLASAGAVALSGAAFAAEPLPAPPPPPFTWTGFYIGINLGGHWRGSSSFDFTSTDTSSVLVGRGLGADQFFGVIPLTGTHGAAGFIAGGQFGFNYQINSLVLGVEADVDGATGRATQIAVLNNVPAGFTDLVTTTSTQQLDWLGTLRGRIGWTPFERVLLYGTGGLAFGNSTSSFSVVDLNLLAAAPLFDFASGSRQVGWTAGGGLEIALPGAWSNWSLKAEYLYYDLGTSTATVFFQDIDTAGNPEFSTLTGRIRHTGNIARAGLNYRFNWPAPAPVVAKY